MKFVIQEFKSILMHETPNGYMRQICIHSFVKIQMLGL